MNLSELTIFDLEATSVDPAEARIIDVHVWWPGGEWGTLVDPGVKIPEEVVKLTGISDADVFGMPTFAQVAEEVAAKLAGRVLAGYNILGYDVKLLAAEFSRAKLDFPWDAKTLVDFGRLNIIFNPRTLGDAVRKYCGREHDGAHRAAADVVATRDVIEGMMEAHPEIVELSVGELALKSNYGKRIADVDGKLYWEGDTLMFAIGKHKGKPVASQPGYVEWMLDSNFPESTKRYLERFTAGEIR